MRHTKIKHHLNINLPEKKAKSTPKKVSKSEKGEKEAKSNFFLVLFFRGGEVI